MNTPAPLPPTNVKGPIVMGSIIAIVFVGGFLLWASLITISSAVIAGGVVKVDSSRKAIQHLEGGVVKEILVDDGDRVEQGQVLVRLDRTRAAAAQGVIETGYYDALAQQARLCAERDGKSTIEFPEELRALTQDSEVQEIIQAQGALFAARSNSLHGQLGIIDEQVLHLQEDIAGLEAQSHAKVDQIQSLIEELDGLTNLLKRGLIDRTRVLTLKREKASLEGELGEHKSQIAAAKSSISEKQLEKYQLQKAFQEGVATDLRRVQAELFDFKEQLLAARHVLQQTEIKAPVKGIVVGRGVHTVGGVVAPGEVILEMVPVNDNLIVEAKILPQDIDNVKVGLPAGVRISAFNQRTTPELNGAVSYVSADIIENPNTGEGYFISRVIVSEEELSKLGSGKDLQPGMTADVMIRTGSRTPMDYLIEPLLVNIRKAFRES